MHFPGSAGGRISLALDVSACCELICLVPGSELSRDFRHRVVHTFLRVQGGDVGLISRISDNVRFQRYLAANSPDHPLRAVGEVAEEEQGTKRLRTELLTVLRTELLQEIQASQREEAKRRDEEAKRRDEQYAAELRRRDEEAKRREEEEAERREQEHREELRRRDDDANRRDQQHAAEMQLRNDALAEALARTNAVVEMTKSRVSDADQVALLAIGRRLPAGEQGRMLLEAEGGPLHISFFLQEHMPGISSSSQDRRVRRPYSCMQSGQVGSE